MQGARLGDGHQSSNENHILSYIYIYYYYIYYIYNIIIISILYIYDIISYYIILYLRAVLVKTWGHGIAEVALDPGIATIFKLLCSAVRWPQPHCQRKENSACCGHHTLPVCRQKHVEGVSGCETARLHHLALARDT